MFFCAETLLILYNNKINDKYKGSFCIIYHFKTVLLILKQFYLFK